VKSGVVALRIEARPLAMWFWPQTISTMGIALLRTPMPKKAAQALGSRGSLTPAILSTRCRASAARATRQATMVSGGSSFTATAMNRNEPPHTIDSTISIAQSDAVMVFWTGAWVMGVASGSRALWMARGERSDDPFPAGRVLSTGFERFDSRRGKVRHGLYLAFMPLGRASNPDKALGSSNSHEPAPLA
jgi:hypothetical protein